MSYVITTFRISNRAILDHWVEAFGCELEAVYPEAGEAVDHASVRLGDSWIMAGTPRDGGHETPVGAGSVYVVLESDTAVDAAYERAVAAGADGVRAPEDQDYGGRDCTLRDRDGNWWSLGSYDPAAG